MAALTIPLLFYRTGKPFGHYGALLAPAIGVVVRPRFLREQSRVRDGWKDGIQARSTFHALAGGLCHCGDLCAGASRPAANLRCREFRTVLHLRRGVPLSPGPLNRTVTGPGDTLSVWGWMPECYVRTGLPPATRDAICHYVISARPLPGLFSPAPSAGFTERSRPAIFIDATPWRMGPFFAGNNGPPLTGMNRFLNWPGSLMTIIRCWAVFN